MIADSLSRLGTETAFEVLARAQALEAQGKDIVHLEIGEPDFDTPRAHRRGRRDALRDGRTHYGPSAGLPGAARGDRRRTSRAPAASSSTRRSVVVTPGGKPIMFFVILAPASRATK